MHRVQHRAMQLKLRLVHKMLLLVVSILLVELVFICSLAWITQGAEQEATRAAHFRSISAKTNSVLTDLYEVVNTLITYHVSKNKSDSAHYQELVDNLPDKLQTLKNLAKDDPYQIATIEKIEPNLQGVLRFIKNYKDSIDRGEVLAAMASVQEWRDNIRGPFHDMVSQLHALAQYQLNQIDPAGEQHYRSLFQQWLLIGVGLNVFLSLWTVSVLAGGITRRLDVLVDNTVRLAAGEKLRSPLPGGDEIARLDHFFHSMARNLEEANHKERAIVDHALDVICSVDQHGVFTKVNLASLNVWGYANDELAGSRLINLVMQEDADRTTESFKKAQATGSDQSFENRIRKKDGSICHMLWSLHWVPSEQAMFCVAHDITDRKLVEEMKQEFFAMVSHDLRTPLTSVASSLALLSEGKLGELPGEAQTMVQRSEAELSRLIQLIVDLLDFARMEAGKLELQMQPEAVSSILERSLNAVEGVARRKNIELKVPHTDARVIADAERIVQVLVNLLSNAIKFSPKNSSITLGITAKDDWIEVRVTDEGPGIPEEQRLHIFDRFKQLGTASETKGFGLGLSISKAIIDGHGGTIGVQGNNGKGSSFYFRLPSA